MLRRSIAELCHADHNGEAAAIATWTANKTPDTWKVWIAQHGTTLYVATDGSRIVGVGMLSDVGEIRLNYILPEARWRGVSKAMLAFMEAEAVRKGISVCRLESTEPLVPSIRRPVTRRTGRLAIQEAGYSKA